MASSEDVSNKTSVVTLTTQEAVSIVAKLTALIGRTSAPGCAMGAPPEIVIVDRGVMTQRIVLSVEHEGAGTWR